MAILVVPSDLLGPTAGHDAFRDVARDHGLRFVLAPSWQRARRLLGEGSYALVVCDVDRAAWAALDLVRDLRARADRTAVLLLGSEPDPAILRRARILGRTTWLDRDSLSRASLERGLRAALGGKLPRREENAGVVLRPPMLDIAPAMIWKTDAAGAFTNFSRRWSLFTGREEAADRGAGWLATLPADDLERWRREFSGALERRRGFRIDVRMRAADGTLRWVRHQGVPTQDAEGAFGGFAGASFEVTDLKRVPRALEEEAERLRRTNRELESFLEAAVHDIAEPLRTLEGQLRELETANARPGVTPTDALGSVRRLQQLLRGLFECTRIATHGASLAHTQMSKPLEWALSNLQLRIRETSAQVRVDALPIVDIDATQIARLLQNLIGNALKFHGGKPPRVHVGVESSGSEWCFFVRDEGSGFDPAHRQRIFEPFTRLDGSGPAGLGLGLTIARKIVQRHGGRIWAESASGRGSIFRFSLPRARA